MSSKSKSKSSGVKTDSKGNLVQGQSLYKGGAPINTTGTYSELKRVSTGSRKSSDVLPPDYKEGVGIAPEVTPDVEPITPTPTVAPIQQPEAPQTGVITPQQALADAKASGVAAPQEMGEGRQAVQQFIPSSAGQFYKPNANSQQVYDSKGTPLSYDQYIAAGGKADFSNVQQGLPDTSLIDQQLAQDPNFAKILQGQQEYNDVVNQQKSLTDTYSQLTKQLGIKSLDTQLMNMKNVIDGTENDIRQEVTKAGGFATESQVLALSSARNKTLIQNYNNLLNVRQQAQDTLNTMIGLAEKDKSLALQSISQKLDIDGQIYQFAQKATDNARSAYEQIINKVGYSGLLEMTGGNDFYSGMIERTLGLPTGGLAKMATTGSAPVKFETVTLGSGKGNVKVRYGYDASGNIVSATNLNTGQPFKSGGNPQATTYKNPSRITSRGNPSPKPTTSAIKAIIKANPNEWGNAADAIDRKYGAGTATKYDKELKNAYAKKATTPSSTPKPSLFDSL